VASEGLEGAGPPPVFFCSFLQILPFVLHFLGGAESHPNPTAFSQAAIFFQKFVFLRVYHAISKFNL